MSEPNKDIPAPEDEVPQDALPEATEPDANERDEQHPHRCRLSFKPERYVHLTSGEVQDHRAWGTLLEGPVEDEEPTELPASTPPKPAASSKAPAAASGSGTPKAE